MFSPYTTPPHPLAQAAAQDIINKVHAYMRTHPDSELHRQGKMFGVLTTEDPLSGEKITLAAFSAQLDGSYFHDSFVPPVYAMQQPPIGTNRDESRRLQQLIFANYNLLNGKGESKNLIAIFAHEKPIIPAEEWFTGKAGIRASSQETLPPSGAGECCAPKLLQYALSHGLKPIALAEFWIGASPKNELHKDGCFYTPCSGRCVPILRHMLQGIEIEPTPQDEHIHELCRRTEIVYEDAYLIVVNKPAGLLSVPGKTDEVSLTTYLSGLHNYTYLQAAHRLDQDTSGLLILAKTEETYKALQAYFQRRDILKRYEAVCARSDGEKALTNEGVLSLPLLPNPYDRPRQMVDHDHGKAAITRYVVREHRADGTMLVDFYPLTGRTHQLRVHAAHPEGLNAPILGDKLYNGIVPTNGMENRLMLHAAEITFTHPATKEEMHFCIPSGF